MHHDTGTGGRQSIDAAPDRVRDTGVVVPDASVDAGVDVGVDAGVDSRIDAQWPVVAGCVSGLPPSPRFNPQRIAPVLISCMPSRTDIMFLSDVAFQGMLFDAVLGSPIEGIALSFPRDLCGFDFNAPITLDVSQSAALPGTSFSTTLQVTIVGPPPQLTHVFPMEIDTVAIDFSVDPNLVDFGTVSAGQSVRIPLTVINALDGAPLANVFATQPAQGPFQLSPNFFLGGTPLPPGDAQPILDAVLNAQTVGDYENTFLVSAFPPGSVIDTRCGVIRTITMRAQVVSNLPPP